MTKPSRDAHLLSGAYVLNALTPPEVDDVETAMRSSEDLRSEVAELSDTAVLLGLSVAPADPPEGLRNRLMALVEVTPQLPPLPAQTDTDEAADQAPERADGAPAHAATVLTGPRHWFLRPSALLAAAAAVVLLFGGGVVVEHAIAPMSQSTEASEFAAITSAPDVKEAHASIAGGGTATVYSSKSQGHSAVALVGATVPSGRVLQFWRVNGSTVTSAGLFQPSDGHHYAILSGGALSAKELAVSVEPAGGSAQPTTRPIVTVSLS